MNKLSKPTNLRDLCEHGGLLQVLKTRSTAEPKKLKKKEYYLLLYVHASVYVTDKGGNVLVCMERVGIPKSGKV